MWLRSRPVGRLLAGIGQRPPDAIILGDLAALAAIRSMNAASSVPVLALLEGGDEATVVAALDAGADQCLLKPFSIEEVMAWLRTALRRSGRILALEGLEVDIARGRIHRHGQENEALETAATVAPRSGRG